ncbi:MAG TPA: 3'-5' exonuclease [Acidimicrobiales bacterium]|nr:3'-5' exonuclease [Acidimicrobiales bacterium]
MSDPSDRDLSEKDPSIHDSHSASGETCYVVVDVETTGLRPQESNIIEIAIVGLDKTGNPTSEWTSLINPLGTGALGAEHIHGITRSMVEDAPVFSELAMEILDQLVDHIIVGHVIEFDLGHLASEFTRAKIPLPNLGSVSLCTRNLARRSLAITPVTLENCCAQLGITIHGAHSALGDTRATAELFREMLASVDETELQRLHEDLALIAWSRPMFTGQASNAKPRLAG